MDMVTLLTMLIALIVGAAVMFLYNRYRNDTVDAVFKTLKEIFDVYGKRLMEDEPELYNELEAVLTKIEAAMSDEEISILEAFDIAKAAVPLVKRLTKYIDKNYK